MSVSEFLRTGDPNGTGEKKCDGREFWWFQSTGEHTKRRWKITMKFLVNQRTSYEPCSIAMLVYQRVCSIKIPLTISTTKRVNTCLIPSPVSWRIQAKRMDPCTSFCSKRACTVSCSGVPFGTQKSEMHFVVIYFGMRCVVPETPKPSFAGYARLHEHIAWTPRPFLALDSRLFRGKMSPQKIGKKQIM